MAPEKKSNKSNRIPVRFVDADTETVAPPESGDSEASPDNQEITNEMAPDHEATTGERDEFDPDVQPAQSSAGSDRDELDPDVQRSPAAELEPFAVDGQPAETSPQADGSGDVAPSTGGPEVAELVATRAEL
ncbi:MAG: hypothetical protein LC775_20160, partial [Acidobacteria bacterium]|nr:hypothetical protein [Acidobacteriota bacterium]